MRKMLNGLIVLILLIPAGLFAEVTRKAVTRIDETVEFVFYDKGKAVAKQIVDKDMNIIKTTGKIPDGKVREYYKSGKLWSEFHYKNNKLEGIAVGYYEDGSLLYKSNHKDGKPEGVSKEYHKNGKLSAETNFKNGKREGISKEFNELLSNHLSRIFDENEPFIQTDNLKICGYCPYAKICHRQKRD